VARHRARNRHRYQRHSGVGCAWREGLYNRCAAHLAVQTWLLAAPPDFTRDGLDGVGERQYFCGVYGVPDLPVRELEVEHISPKLVGVEPHRRVLLLRERGEPEASVLRHAAHFTPCHASRTVGVGMVLVNHLERRVSTCRLICSHASRRTRGPTAGMSRRPRPCSPR
jgi:hypothetical protein